MLNVSSRGAEVGHMSSYPENGPLAISDVGGDKKKKVSEQTPAQDWCWSFELFGKSGRVA